MDYYTDKSGIITTTRTTEATTEFSTTSTSTSTPSSTAATELVTDVTDVTQILTITTEFVMPTVDDGSDFSTEKSPETKTEFVTEVPKIPATWTDWVSSYIRLKMLEYYT